MTAPAPIAQPWRAWAKNNSLGVNFTWRAISIGRLKVRRVGKRMLVLDNDGRAFLEALPEGPAARPANLERSRHCSLGETSKHSLTDTKHGEARDDLSKTEKAAPA
jgi:hypothetical protein